MMAEICSRHAINTIETHPYTHTRPVHTTLYYAPFCRMALFRPVDRLCLRQLSVSLACAQTYRCAQVGASSSSQATSGLPLQVQGPLPNRVQHATYLLTAYSSSLRLKGLPQLGLGAGEARPNDRLLIPAGFIMYCRFIYLL